MISWSGDVKVRHNFTVDDQVGVRCNCGAVDFLWYYYGSGLQSDITCRRCNRSYHPVNDVYAFYYYLYRACCDWLRKNKKDVLIGQSVSDYFSGLQMINEISLLRENTLVIVQKNKANIY